MNKLIPMPKKRIAGCNGLGQGPCNDHACRRCDALRADMRSQAERFLKHRMRKGLLR